MNLSDSHLLYSEFLLNNNEELLNRLVKMLLKGDIITYLNLHNYFFSYLPVVPLHFKLRLIDSISTLLSNAVSSESNPYAATFFAKCTLSEAKSAEKIKMAKGLFLQMMERNQLIGFVEMARLKIGSSDEIEAKSAIEELEKALSLDEHFGYTYLTLGDYYSKVTKEQDKALPYYLLAEKARLPWATSKVAYYYLHKGNLKNAYKYLNNVNDEYMYYKHIIFGLYYENKGKVNKDYIKAFKHYLKAFALLLTQGGYVYEEHLSRFFNSNNEQLSRQCVVIYKKCREIIDNYQKGQETKPLDFHEILEQVADEFHPLKEIDIGASIAKPTEMIVKQKIAQLHKDQKILQEVRKEVENKISDQNNKIKEQLDVIKHELSKIAIKRALEQLNGNENDPDSKKTS